MITWAQLAQFIPIAAVLVTTGMMLERIRSLRVAVDKLADAFATSAKDQGRRIGNVESYLGLNADGIPVERLQEFSGRVREPR